MSIRRSVVLPAPLGPASARRSRRSSLNDTPSKSTSPANSFRRLDAITTAMPVWSHARVNLRDGGEAQVRMAGMSDTERWSELGQQLRVDSVRAAAVTKSGHPTSSMSAADLMAVLIDKYLRYDFDDPENPANDHLIFSKGHASPLLYSIYKAVGAIEDEELLTFRKFGSRLEGHPTPDHPVGRRGHRLAGPGAADRGRRRAGGQAPRPAPVPRLGALRRQRDGRGLDVGGLRARVLRQARQPDRHHRRQPARPARRDDARLGSRLVRAPGGGLSAATRSRSTATTSTRSTRPTRRRSRSRGVPP